MQQTTDNENLALWMSHLDTAVNDVFLYMLGIPCHPAFDRSTSGVQLKVSIGVSGGLEARCTLYFSFPAGKAAALAFTGDESMDGDSIIDDAVGEIGNMIIGALKNKFDVASTSYMTVPSVSREEFSLRFFDAQNDCSWRDYTFMGNAMQIRVAMPAS